MIRNVSAAVQTAGGHAPPLPTPRVSVEALCAAIDTELIGAAKLALSLQETVSHLIGCDGLEADDMRHVQNLDRLTQVLSDLAAVVRVLPSAWSDGASVDGASVAEGSAGSFLAPSLPRQSVTNVVRLHDVAAALLGQTLLPCSHVGDSAEGGQVDWL